MAKPSNKPGSRVEAGSPIRGKIPKTGEGEKATRGVPSAGGADRAAVPERDPPPLGSGVARDLRLHALPDRRAPQVGRPAAVAIAWNPLAVEGVVARTDAAGGQVDQRRTLADAVAVGPVPAGRPGGRPRERAVGAGAGEATEGRDPIADRFAAAVRPGAHADRGVMTRGLAGAAVGRVAAFEAGLGVAATGREALADVLAEADALGALRESIRGAAGGGRRVDDHRAEIATRIARTPGVPIAENGRTVVVPDAVGTEAAAERPETGEKRMPRDDLRERLLDCLGGPWPETCNLKPQLRETIAKDGYRIESLTYEVVQHGLTTAGPDEDSLHTKIVNRVERELIAQVMLACNNVQTKAAAKLGINRNTLHKKLKEYDLEPQT